MKKLVVTNNPKKFLIPLEGVEVISSRSYLTDPAFARMQGVRVFNLAYDYSYQSKGYYVSLLAEARGHKVVPSVKNMQDLRTPTIVRIVSDELDDLMQHSLHDIKSNEFILSIYFGQNLAQKHAKLSSELFKLFQAPLMRARFVKQKKWMLFSLRAIAYKDVPDNHDNALNEFARQYFARQRYPNVPDDPYIYDLAILIGTDEESRPSNNKAIKCFEEVAEELGFSVELITKDSYNRVGEFDALFIRETTSVNHHTYRFARRAQSEGMVVIDDPESILRCTNKVYLAELLQIHRIKTPKTLIVHSDNVDRIVPELGLPCVLKLPDSSFSVGVDKVRTEEELQLTLSTMFESSDLIIAQKYMPTKFDWRVGVLNGKVLFACKYFMAKGHWQIYNWDSAQKDDIEGNFEGVAVKDIPAFISETAIRVSKLIGDGLYGVDIKEVEGQALVIEVNDNPSIDAGVEDKVEGKALYKAIIGDILRRLQEKHTG